jgi:hypothetical protein
MPLSLCLSLLGKDGGGQSAMPPNFLLHVNEKED